MSDLNEKASKYSHTNSDNSNNLSSNANTEEYYTVFDYYTRDTSSHKTSSKNPNLVQRLGSSIYNNIHTIGLTSLIAVSVLTYFAEKELSKFKQFYGSARLLESSVYLENTYDIGSISKGYGSLNKLTSQSIFPDKKITYIDGVDEISASEENFFDSKIEEVHILIDSDSSKIEKYYSSDINSNTIRGMELKTMFEVWNVEYNLKRRFLYLKEHPPKKEVPQLHLVKNEIFL